MSVQPKSRMGVEEVLHRPERFELLDGAVFAMAPRRVRHAEAWFAVRVDEATSFGPDAAVHCGARPDAEATVAAAPVVAAPVVVLEVPSPRTGRIGTGRKRVGHFRVARVMHHLIVDPIRRTVIHHRRGAGALIETRIRAAGAIGLDPPGLRLDRAGRLPGPWTRVRHP